MHFQIKRHDGAGEVLGRVRATSPEAAALAFVRRRNRRLVAYRVTGEYAGNGVFQAYAPLGHGERGLTADGDLFHVAWP